LCRLFKLISSLAKSDLGGPGDIKLFATFTKDSKVVLPATDMTSEIGRVNLLIFRLLIVLKFNSTSSGRGSNLKPGLSTLVGVELAETTFFSQLAIRFRFFRTAARGWGREKMKGSRGRVNKFRR